MGLCISVSLFVRGRSLHLKNFVTLVFGWLMGNYWYFPFLWLVDGKLLGKRDCFIFWVMFIVWNPRKWIEMFGFVVLFIELFILFGILENVEKLIGFQTRRGGAEMGF